MSKMADFASFTVLRAGSAFETGLKRVLPDCRTGRLLIQSNIRTGEPELHYLKLPEHIESHDSVLILDPQVSHPSTLHSTVCCSWLSGSAMLADPSSNSRFPILDELTLNLVDE